MCVYLCLSVLHNEGISSFACGILGAVLLLQQYCCLFRSCVIACLCYIAGQREEKEGKEIEIYRNVIGEVRENESGQMEGERERKTKGVEKKLKVQ